MFIRFMSLSFLNITYIYNSNVCGIDKFSMNIKMFFDRFRDGVLGWLFSHNSAGRAGGWQHRAAITGDYA